MKKDTKKKALTDWDWTTLVAAWRYYEHGHTITSYLFPHNIVSRFFTGDYDDKSCKKIATQFVEIDHYYGPNDEHSGWVGDYEFNKGDKRSWRLFYFYLKAWLCGFPKASVTIGGKSGHVEVFRADGEWYSREGYEKYGEKVSPYYDFEIDLMSIEQKGGEE